MKEIIKKRQFQAVFTILVLAVALWALKTSGKSQPQSPIQKVGFQTAQEVAANKTIGVSGFVRGENRAEISPSTSGKILRILKHEGDNVKKGEVLAFIDASQSQAQVNAASASVEALKKTLSNSEDYYNQTVDQTKESGAGHEGIQTAKRARDLQIQATKAQLIAAEGTLEIARSAKNNFALVAPFTGTVASVYGREGGFANFSMPLFSLSTQKGLEIETYVSASDARLVSLGLIANFKMKDGNVVNATVTNVAPGSDSNNFKTLVRLHLNDETGSLRLGDFLEGELLVPTQQSAIYVPQKSIVNRGGTLIVFTADENNAVHQNLIETGNENGLEMEITKGISAGQKIVVEGQQYITEGSKVEIYESR